MPDPDNDRYNVVIELPNGEDSAEFYEDVGGGFTPQRLVLHELIVQLVSDRKILQNT